MNKNNPLRLLKGEVSLKDVFYYLQGTLRYKVFYNKSWSFLMRFHIRDQIEFRIFNMNKDCYNQGSCVICGCETTALQMANKCCDGYEYPPIVSRSKWKKFIKHHEPIKQGAYSWVLNNQNKLVIIKQTPTGYVQVK